MNKEINNEISKYFLNDSRQYLTRYTLLKPHQTENSDRSKLLIDIVFSFECSLKALLFLESNLNEQETYKLIQTCGQDLKCLIDTIHSTEIAGLVSKIDDNFAHFFISSRYTLHANINFRNDTGRLEKRYYSTITNPIWLEELYQDAKKLYEYVNSKTDHSIRILPFADIDIEKKVDRTKRLRKLNGK